MNCFCFGIPIVVACAPACSPPSPSGPSGPAPAAGGSVSKLVPTGPPWFEEVARANGVVFDHVRGFETRYWFPECIGSGLGWLDYDGDGRLDLFLVQAGDMAPGERAVPGDRLFKNLGGGRFEDVTERVGIRESAYGMGCTVGDYDADGDPDLYVTNFGPNVLWRNEGNGTFTDATASAGVGHGGWGTASGFFDQDRDGDLDLFVVNYLRWSIDTEIECKSSYGERDYCAPVNYNRPAQSVFYRNDGGGHFTDASAEAGLLTAFGNGLGLALADFDGDGWLDAYVSNDGMPNQLWINQKNGRFADRAVITGAAVNRNGAAEASMGTVPADLDGDGWIDLFITKLRGESNTVYMNKRGVFTDRTPQTGLALASLQYTGFGNGCFDFDLDGELDLYVANGRVGTWKPVFREDDPYAEPNQLFRGRGGLKWEEVFPQGGTAEALIGNSRGAAFADYDDDGDVDIAYADNHGALKLLRNVVERRGTWIGLALVDERGSAVPGATAALEAGGRKLTRMVAICSSYCSANDARLHAGLGAATKVDSVRVTWPGGQREDFGPFDAGAYHTLRRGAGR